MSNGSSTPTDEPHSPSSEPGRRDDEEADYLDDLPDGSGCTEIWEYLSDQRGPKENGKSNGDEP